MKRGDQAGQFNKELICIKQCRRETIEKVHHRVNPVPQTYRVTPIPCSGERPPSSTRPPKTGSVKVGRRGSQLSQESTQEWTFGKRRVVGKDRVCNLLRHYFL